MFSLAVGSVGTIGGTSRASCPEMLADMFGELILISFWYAFLILLEILQYCFVRNLVLIHLQSHLQSVNCVYLSFKGGGEGEIPPNIKDCCRKMVVFPKALFLVTIFPN